MSIQRPGSGTTALDRLGSHLNDVALTCPSCGYEDEEGEWEVATTGREVRYEHRCPSCDAVSTRTLRL